MAKKWKKFKVKKKYTLRSATGKKKKSKIKDAPKLRTIKGTIGSKEIKQQSKILLRQPEIDKEYLKTQAKCNHSGSTISVAEFKSMTPIYAAYAPLLDAAVRKFGEDHVCMCKRCYDILVERSMITKAAVEEAAVTLYVAANTVTANMRLEKKEVKKYGKLRFDELPLLVEPILKGIGKVEKAEAKRANNSKPGEKRNLNYNNAADFMDD